MKKSERQLTLVKLSRLSLSEGGVETIEWIGLAAAVVALLAGVLLFVSTNGGEQVGSSITETWQILIYNASNSETSGGSLDQSQELNLSSLIEPSVGLPALIIGKPKVGQPSVGQPEVNIPETGESAAAMRERIGDKYHLEIRNGDKEWTKYELILLEDTLRSLPPDFYGKASIHEIIRDSSNNGAGGVYYGSKGPIRIYDRAYEMDKYDQSHYGNFKATIAHELTHGLQYYNPKNDKTYGDAYDNPLMKDWAKTTGWKKSWWGLGEWEYTGKKDELPTGYAGTNPKEDMAESVVLYMYNPEKLSQNRYDFLKEHVFNGKEYKK